MGQKIFYSFGVTICGEENLKNILEDLNYLGKLPNDYKERHIEIINLLDDRIPETRKNADYIVNDGDDVLEYPEQMRTFRVDKYSKLVEITSE